MKIVNWWYIYSMRGARCILHFSKGFLSYLKNVCEKYPKSGILLIPLKPMLPSYRNQPIHFLCKSNDWFLYPGNNGLKVLKKKYIRNWAPKNAFRKSNSRKTAVYLLWNIFIDLQIGAITKNKWFERLM